MYAGIISKPPFTSAEHLQAVGAFSIPYNHVVSGRGRYIISPIRLGILVQDREVRNAQVLLETTDYTISDIAALIGYDNPMYFSRLFRKAKGLSPSKYRKVYREKFIAEVTQDL